jgi:hypothetical protein
MGWMQDGQGVEDMANALRCQTHCTPNSLWGTGTKLVYVVDMNEEKSVWHHESGYPEATFVGGFNR